ncbi:MAG: hypothetical protein V4594_16405 [Bacteroidota bacterium]
MKAFMPFTTKVILFLLLLTGISCSKKKTAKEPEPGPKTEVLEKKQWLPVKLESSQLVITLKYAGDNNQLTDIFGTDGYSTSITYKNNLPYEIVKSRNQVPFQLVDYATTKANELRARSFDKNGAVSIPTGFYVLIYDGQGQLTGLKNHQDNGDPLSETVMTYVAGNVSSLTLISNAQTQKTENYTSDLKNGIFKHVNSAERLLLESRYFYFKPGPNNVTRISNPKSAADEVSFAYVYNAEDYPSQMTVTKNGTKQVFSISYAALK